MREKNSETETSCKDLLLWKNLTCYILIIHEMFFYVSQFFVKIYVSHITLLVGVLCHVGVNENRVYTAESCT